MKNKKGMTLMETIISIMILSIAGLMLFSGFSAVMKTMGRASEYKNSSDMLYSYVEGSNDAELIRTTKAEEKLTSGYVITNGKGVSVSSNLRVSTISFKDNTVQVIDLKDIEGETLNRVEEVFASVSSLAKDLSDEINSVITPPGDYDNVSHDMALSAVFTDYLKDSWDTFPTALLPNDMKSVDGQFIKAGFPWDNGGGRSNVYHGGMLVYLNPKNTKVVDNASVSARETIRIVYDYESDDWYYYKPSSISMNNKYKIGFDFMTSTTNFYIDGNTTTIKSWSNFLTHIKSSGSEWKKLDKKATFDSNNPDSVWVDMQ